MAPKDEPAERAWPGPGAADLATFEPTPAGVTEMPAAPDCQPEAVVAKPTAPVPLSDGAGTAPGATAVFAGFLADRCHPDRSRLARRLTSAGSLALHAGVLAFAFARSGWHVEELSPPRVAVSFLSLSPGLPPLGPDKVARARSAAPPKRVAMPQPDRKPMRRPAVVPPPEAAAPAPSETADVPAVAGSSAGAPGSTGQGGVGRVLPEAERMALTGQYLNQILRPRVAAHFEYPPEAERLGAEGTVIVELTLDGRGQLLGVRTRGACREELLCEAALRTVRAASPFPPPPPALAGGLVVEVPLTYKLQP